MTCTAYRERNTDSCTQLNLLDKEIGENIQHVHYILV